LYEDIEAMIVHPRKFELRKSTIDAIPNGHTLVKLRACGICQGTELHSFWTKGPQKPFTPGHQGAGEIVGKGANVRGFEIGERVVGGGQYRRFQLLLPDQLVKIPEGVSYESATQATEIAGMIDAIDRAGVTTEDKVVIIGSGPMGNLVLQVVRLRSPEMIIATDLYDERLRYAERFGADYVINACRDDQVREVMDLTGDGASIVIEAVGSNKCVQAAVNMAKPEGKVVLWGTLDEPLNDSLETLFKRKSLNILAPWIFWNQSKTEELTKRALKLMQRGAIKVDPLISHRFKLEDIERAFFNLEKNPYEIMKVIILP